MKLPVTNTKKLVRFSSNHILFLFFQYRLHFFFQRPVIETQNHLTSARIVL